MIISMFVFFIKAVRIRFFHNRVTKRFCQFFLRSAKERDEVCPAVVIQARLQLSL